MFKTIPKPDGWGGILDPYEWSYADAAARRHFGFESENDLEALGFLDQRLPQTGRLGRDGGGRRVVRRKLAVVVPAREDAAGDLPARTVSVHAAVDEDTAAVLAIAPLWVRDGVHEAV